MIENNDNDTDSLNLEDSFLDPFDSQIVQDLLSKDFLKTDPLLTEWIETGIAPAHILKLGSRSSVLMLVKNDPTLAGTVAPVGSFKFGDFNLYWVHTTVDGPKDIMQLSGNDDVIRIIADNSNIEDAEDPYGSAVNVDHLIETYNPLSDPGSNPTIDTQNLNTRRILGADYVEDEFGYDGTGTVVNVHDTGIDFGHTALIGTMALDSNGKSAAFDGTGGGLAITNQWSEQYYRELGDDATADIFKPLFSDSNNKIDISGYEKLMVWSVNNFKVMEMETDLDIPLPDFFDVSGVPGNITGYQFGVAVMYNSVFWNLVPFLSVDSNNDTFYDSLYFDWETGYYMSGIDIGIIPVNEYLARSPFSFSEFGAYTDTGNPYLSVDFTGEDDVGSTELSTPDGYIDMSLGALGNVMDVKNITGRLGTGDPLVRGIEKSGIGFGFFYDYGAHGTGVAGTIAAQDVSYQIQQNASLYSIRGASPGTKILGTMGLIADSADIYSMLWISGYEPDSSFEWNFVNDHIANISSNSWGFPQFSDLVGINDDLVGGYDFYSLFFELLTPPGYLSPEHPGMIFVVSAGNSGPGYGTGGSPVSPSLILVGASTSSWWREHIEISEPWGPNQPSDQIVGFSSPGPSLYNYPKVDIVTTGAFDYSALPSIPYIYTQGELRYAGGNGTFQLFSGTSEAAPFTAGVLSTLLQAWKDENNATITPDLAKTILKSSAVDLGFDVYHQGAGRASIERGVHLILNGSLPSGEELYLINSTKAYETAGERIGVAFEFWFGGTFRLDATEQLPNSSSLIKHPSSEVSFSDTAIYGSIISPGETYTANLTLDNTTNVIPTAYKYEAYYNDSTSPFSSQQEWNYHFLDDIFDLTKLQEADMIQFSANVDNEEYTKIYDAGSWLELGIGKHHDRDNDSVVDYDERTLDTFTFNNNAVMTLFANNKVTTQNSMLMVRDKSLDENYEGGNITVPVYTLHVRAYKRVLDNAIAIGAPSNNNYQVTIDPVDTVSPGFYQGFIKFVGSNGGYVLAEYSYSVPLQVDEFNAGGGWSEISGLTNRPFDNGLFGSIDWGWRASTGDWRVYDIEFIGDVATANSLALELEWTNDGTVIDINIFDHDGLHIANTDINYLGDGIYNSSANAPPNRQRLLVNVTDYRLGNTMSGDNLAGNNSIFTIALHATTVDGESGILEPIKLRATWLTDTMSSLGKPEPTLTTSDSTFLNDGMHLTHNEIGLIWTNVSIPSIGFTNVNLPHEYKVSRPDIYHFDETLASEDLSAYEDAESADWSYELYLKKDMEVSIHLSWEQFETDLDLIIVPKGKDFTGGNSIIKGTSSGSTPEKGTAIVPSSGQYIIVIDYFQGDGTPQHFILDVIARDLVFTSIQNLDNKFEIDLVNPNFIEGDYLVESVSKGWNENFKYSKLVRFDAYAPQLNFSQSIPEIAVNGQVSIGTVYDASIYNFTLSHNGIELISLTNVTGTQYISIDATLIKAFFQDTEFSVSGQDQFGHPLSQTISVFRTDDTQPVFLLEPERQEVLIDIPGTLSWLIDDISNGTFNLKISGASFMNGSWTNNLQLDIVLTFDTLGSKFITLEIIDQGGNTHRSFVRLSIVNELTTDTNITSSSTNSTTDDGPFGDLPSDAGRKILIPIIIGVIFVSAAVAAGTIYMRRKSLKTRPNDPSS